MLGFDLSKRHSKGEKHIAQMENQIIWRTAKFLWLISTKWTSQKVLLYK